MAFFGDLVELGCHMNTDAWARLSDSTAMNLFGTGGIDLVLIRKTDQEAQGRGHAVQ